MARVIKANGNKKAPESYINDRGAGIPRMHGIFAGIVKRNDDSQYMGRLQVYIPEFGGDPESDSSWYVASYASPFAGSTSIFDQGQNIEEYEDTIKSYGFWAVPPDIDSQVLVAFADGKTDKCYWFACMYQRGTQVSVPGLPAGKTHKGENIPVAPKNRKDLDPDLKKYVAHTPAYNALKTQGLENDPLRGTTTSGAMRETPSKVIGLLTPGQHQLVLDDGDKDGNNRLIRIRTTNGTQLLLDDVAGHIYLVSKNGESWVELSADGRIHLYGSKDINIRSQENINLYADNNVNIEAGLSINLKANYGNFQASGIEVSMLAETNTKITSGETSNILSGLAHYETAAVIHMNGPPAAPANVIPMHNLAVNQGIKNSICSIVPEHEPWAGHSGMINPVGTGNMQTQKDPAPDQIQSRLPKENEMPAPIIPTPDKGEEVSIAEAVVSEELIDVIKEQNGYTPVNTSDDTGESGGYGSVIIPSEPPPASVTAPGSNVFDLKLPPGVDTVALAPSIFKDFQTKLKEVTNAMPAGSSTMTDKISSAASIVEGSVAPPNSADTAKIKDFRAKLKEATDAMAIGLSTMSNRISSVPGIVAGGVSVASNSFKDATKILSQGISPDKAENLLYNDLARNQRDVKNILTSAGVTKLPQNVFDGLISYQNQTGDASTAFIKGQKVDLTPLYKTGSWDQVASFIAADERDRNRRIVEASIIANNNYGPVINQQHIINKGMARANEMIAKGKLNQQTASGATDQQRLANATNYFNQTGKTVDGSTYEFNSVVNKNNIDNNLANITNKNIIGPWPY